MQRIETRMQSRALDEYRPGETTHADVAKRFGVSRSAISHRLRKHRLSNGITIRPPLNRRKTPARFVQLSTVENI